MIKKLLIATLYSIIAFCIVSYASVMISLLSRVGNPSEKPVTNIGFPFKYYYQFWCRGSDSPNCGWRLDNFLLDCFITWGSCVLIYFLIKRRSKKTMRDHLEILAEIDKILLEKNLLTEREELKNEIRAGSTGGEICLGVGSKLLKLKQNKQVAQSIGYLIKEYISFCNANGLYPKKEQAKN